MKHESMSVGFIGILGDQVGIIPLLSIAAGITIVAGIVGVWLLPREPYNRTRQDNQRP